MSINTIEQQVVDFLNEYSFQKIWTEPVSELRSNVEPIKIYERTRTGSISYLNYALALPNTNKAYYIYVADLAAYRGGADFPPNKWISTDKLCNTCNILFHTYTESGLMLHKAFVYIYYFEWNQSIIIAIEKQMYDAINQDKDDTDPHQRIYTTLYFDSDYVNDIDILSVHIPYNDKNFEVTNQILDYINNTYNPDVEQRLIFQHGNEVSIDTSHIIYQNEYIDIIVDKNIIISFDVDLTQDLYNAGYFSEMDQTLKLLVHIPKNLNPDNKVLTHNTCDFFVRKKDKDYLRKQYIGRYMHRCADLNIYQITHNDFSIPTYILDAHRDHFHEENITLHVVVRQHEKDNILIKEQSYLYLLYEHHTDEEIIKFLSGHGDTRLPFWTAQQLEQSEYTKLMFDVPNYPVPENIQLYIDALGYYHTLALLCQRVNVAIVTDATEQAWKFRKSFIYENKPVFANVYRNGFKILNTQITITNDNQFVYIKLNTNIILNIGDIIIAELYIDGPKLTLYPLLELTNNSFELPYEDVQIYIEHDTPFYYAKGIKYESTKSYELITNNTGKYVVHPSTNESGAYTIQFGYPLYDQHVIITNKFSTYKAIYNLNPSLIEGNTLVISLFQLSMDENLTNIPILNFTNQDLYLNGRYLVQDIDYLLQPVIHPSTGFISFYQIIIQNMSYLQNPEDHDNILEVILNVSDMEDTGKGFIVQDVLVPTIEDVILYFPEISSTFINGRFEHDLLDYGRYYKAPTNKYMNHHVFEIKTSVPKFLQEFLLRYHENIDRARIITLNEYFNKDYNKHPEIVVLQESHMLYSTFLNTIIRDIISGEFQLAYDPDLTKFKNRLTNYLHIQNMDIIYKPNLDLDHIDLYPHYKQFLTDPATRLLIQSLVKALLPRDLVTAGDTIEIQV
jgi:hypothetical protein